MYKTLKSKLVKAVVVPVMGLAALLGTYACNGSGGTGGTGPETKITLQLKPTGQYASGANVIQKYNRTFTDTTGQGATFVTLEQCIGSNCTKTPVSYVIPANGTAQYPATVKAPAGTIITETYTGTNNAGGQATASGSMRVQSAFTSGGDL